MLASGSKRRDWTNSSFLPVRGLVTFITLQGTAEYMCLFTSDDFTGEIISCDEGDLEWVKKDRFSELNLWEGDYIFLRLLEERENFFSLKLVYDNDKLVEAVLDGDKLEHP